MREMGTHHKILMILVVALVLIVILLGGLFAIFQAPANAPTVNFQGPASAPYAEGPTSQPPAY
jgi:hypothetical protein